MNGKKLRVAIISKSNADGGGASRVAEDLAVLLNTVENTVAHHWMGYRGSVWRPHMKLLFGGRWFRKIHRICRLFSSFVGMPDFLTPEILNLSLRKEFDYDIFHFHDISTAFSPVSMRWLAKRKPVVWTFHDCSPFTGGCLYPMGCTAFLARCGKCPQLGIWPLLTHWDLTGTMQSYKRETARRALFIPIAPSEWMADQTMKAGMFSRKPRVIPYSVDSEVYRPLEKNSVRNALGLELNSFTVLVSAWYLPDRRKGTRYALSALRTCNRPVSVLVTGHNSGSIKDQLKGLNVHFAGYVREAAVMAQYYTAADVFLFPTLADNLPNSVLEAMASGTPTIGFRTGGVPDMVEHGVNGWLADPEDVENLVKGLQISFDDREVLKQWGVESRIRARKTYSRRAFLDAHLELYGEILKGQYPGLTHLA